MSNNKYTNLEQSKRLKEIGFEAEADGYWVESDDSCLNHISFIKNENINLYYRDEKLIESFSQQYYDEEDKYDVAIPSYRLDTLLSVLPNWCFKEDRLQLAYAIGYRNELTEQKPLSYWESFIGKLRFLLKQLFNSRGQEALEAAAKLIILLDENNVELARKED